MPYLSGDVSGIPDSFPDHSVVLPSEQRACNLLVRQVHIGVTPGFEEAPE